MKTKSKALDQVNEAFTRAIKSRRPASWGIIPRPPGCTLPTTEQLAHLAAQLAHGGPIDDGRPLCASALNLWHTANEALDLQRQANTEGQLEIAAIAECRAKHPDPPRANFPMNLDHFLKWQWPGKDTGERNKLFKLWLRHVLRTKITSPSKQDVTRRYAEARKETIDRPRFYDLRNSLTDWHANIYMPKVKSEAGQAGGKAKPKPDSPVTSEDFRKNIET